MSSFLKRYLGGDIVIWFVFFALCVFSIIELYSASSQLAYKANSYVSPVLRHVIFLAVGIAAAFGIHLIPSKVIRLLAYLGLAASIALLAAVLLFGETTNEAQRLLKVGPIKFQPSELAKLSLVIFAADMLSRIKDNRKEEKRIFWWLMGVSAVICILIFFENFSTAALLFLIVLIMCFIQKVSWRRLLTVVLIVFTALVTGFALMWNIPEGTKLPKRLDRAHTWVKRVKEFSKETDKATKYVMTDDNRQPLNGKIAIARGGTLGVFPGNSVQRDYLAQAYSDFIFAIMIEETGILGAFGVIILYLVLMFRAGIIATRSRQVFPAMLVMGLSLIIVIQAFIHMAVVTGIIPVTGQPLPIISRGGTSIIVTCIYFGIILGVTRSTIKDRQEDGELAAQKYSTNAPEVKLDEL
ncbi:MAG: FtsW/RodA/SpoVE family cell cycle protein [Prevotellaceae bacterium]|jgi:cell division protein FtsW|nr:FtsW/RodA/SpoVE family cell cycle protein [Prevotellaceae bacterium]